MTPQDKIVILKADRENLHQRVRELVLENTKLTERLGPRGLEVVEIDGSGHYVNAAVKAEIERLRSMLPQTVKPAESVERVKAREYECFIEDHEPLPWTPGRCAGYAGRGSHLVHLMRCKRRDGHGIGGLFCKQHAKTNGY